MEATAVDAVEPGRQSSVFDGLRVLFDSRDEVSGLRQRQRKQSDT